MSLTIQNLSKEFNGATLYNDFSIDIKEGTITCILGPSGCGKTTLLNMISGTLKPDQGTFTGFDGKVQSYIFQEPRLLPWKTVEQNLAFVLTHIEDTETKEKLIKQFLRLVELDKYSHYYPSQLSGGMKQRVAIARAFAYPSDIILMDEPLKTLDFKLKQTLMKAFGKLWQLDKRTVLFVTHDVEEALTLGNDIYLFSKQPVTIKQKFTISTPIAERSIDSDELVQLKRNILREMD
ncbi:MAG: ABC transporter ATP-binding protein [Tenuifilaceae bacterium]|jgi:NitT/TauT family transport system ATP-binding protein|nr:ABC transporter ATP-binding protein [Tenuifilaceae bacterium]